MTERTAYHSEKVDRVARAINQAWNDSREVPFPLYQQEAEKLAIAAIAALLSYDREVK